MGREQVEFELQRSSVNVALELIRSGRGLHDMVRGALDIRRKVEENEAFKGGISSNEVRAASSLLKKVYGELGVDVVYRAWLENRTKKGTGSGS